MTYHLTLDGQALRTNPDHEYLPGRDPYDHQLRMDRIFNERDKFFAMNTAPTGGGKTDSWLKAVLDHQLNTIAFYPRNSLVKDQKASIRSFIEDTYPEDISDDVAVTTITGSKLGRLQDEALGDSSSKGDVLVKELQRKFRENEFVIMLTNPDIFVQMYRGLYSSNNVKLGLSRFEVAVSDEFHLCTLKEENTLLDILEEMYTADYKNMHLSKVVFLSATPNRRLQRKLDRHMKGEFINISGKRGQRPLTAVDTDGNWRAIMPPINFEFRTAPTFKAYGRMFGDDNIDHTLDFCRRDGRTLVLLDGLSEVNDAYYDLLEHLPPDSIVHRITGLHDEDKERKLAEFDYLASNSAVEVGIDFDVDRMIFSAANGSSLIQRLGRLRNKDSLCEAVCYVPQYVVDAFQSLPNTDGLMTRQGFEHVVDSAYHTATVPDSFSYRYSALESYHHAMSFENRAGDLPADKRHAKQEEALKKIERHYFDPYGRDYDRDMLGHHFEKQETDLLDQLQPYRSNSITTLIYDTQSNEIRTYSPITLIRNEDIEFVPQDEFYQRVPDSLHEKARGEESFTEGYCIRYGTNRNSGSDDSEDDESGGDVRVIPSPYLRYELEKSVDEREPIVTDGLQLWAEGGLAPGLQHFNDKLQTRKFICYAANGDSYEVAGRLNLDPFFRLYDLHNVRNHMSLALGHNALYLHCHVEDTLRENQAVNRRGA